jgi:hypothetical protein
MRHTVDKCPHCGDRHDYAVKLEPAPLVFGGRPSQKSSTNVPTVVACPAMRKPFETSVSVPQDEKFVEVVLWPYAKSPAGENGYEGSTADGSRSPELPRTPVEGNESRVDPATDEYVDWVRASRATGLKFGKNMLTTSSGAVAVYFAVLKYLGYEKVPNSPSIFFTVVPPVLFTCATAAFAIALRPALARVNSASFTRWRDRRLLQMNWSLVVGTTLLILGLTMAVGVYVDLFIVK